MTQVGIAEIAAVNVEDGTADYMGDGCWVFQRLEETARGRRWHSFGITEEDRQAMLASEGALTIPVDDGEAHYMGDGYFVLSRSEQQGGRMAHHAIAVTVEELERLGDVANDPWRMMKAA